MASDGRNHQNQRRMALAAARSCLSFADAHGPNTRCRADGTSVLQPHVLANLANAPGVLDDAAEDAELVEDEDEVEDAEDMVI